MGIKDMVLVYLKDDIMYSYDLPCINFYEDFVIRSVYKNKKRCEICYNKKFKIVYECGNCKKLGVQHVMKNVRR